MRKKHELDEEEKSLFQNAMRGVRLLSHTKINPAPKAPTKYKPKSKPEDPSSLALTESDYAPSVGSAEHIEFSRGGLQHKMLRNLRQGKYNVDAILDMHGMTVIEAKTTLIEFLLEAKARKLRFLLIIHGKGHGGDKPVLKNKVNEWLRQIDFVLAFCSAKRDEGGTGAVYVLLSGKGK